MPKLIILRGNSGSGKSTIAKALQHRFGQGTLLIPHDTVRRELLLARDGEGTPALPLLIELLRYGRRHAQITILEGILDAQVYRPLFEEALSLFDEEIYAYYYDLPFEVTLERHLSKPNRADFGEADMRRWWKERDFIGIIPEVCLTQSAGLDETVARICADVTDDRSDDYGV